MRSGALLVTGLALGALYPFVSQKVQASDGSPPRVPSTLFEQVAGLVGTRSLVPLSRDSLALKAARGLVEQLKDPYAELLQPAALGQMNKQLGQRYGGIGMSMEPGDTSRGQAAMVVRVFPGTPAAAAGLSPGDGIIGIDGMAVRGWSLERVTAAITGPIGATVRLQVERIGVTGSRDIPITRAAIHISSVPVATVVDGHIGVVRLESFGEEAAKEVAAAMDSLAQTQGATKFVLDMRGNPGGRLDEATALADYFLPVGAKLASVGGRDGITDSFLDETPARNTAPLIVLIDNRSASASEIVAGALQDNDRALVIGMPSFGKGLVQSVFPLEDGYALKLTTGTWLTPVGRNIHRRREPGDTVLAGSIADTLGRPIVKSVGGRRLKAGGGIVPDSIILSGDVLTRDESAVLRSLQPSSGPRLRRILYAEVYSRGVTRGQTVPMPLPTAWVVSATRSLVQAKVFPVTSRALEGLVREWMEDIALPLAGGEESLYLRRMVSDKTLQEAARVLRRSATQSQLVGITLGTPKE